MSHHDHSRDPCPVVILNDFGGAFAMGAVGGTLWHGIKGARNAPRGDRIISSLNAIKARAPILGGNFGVWGGMYSTYDCTVKGIRGKEDAWNPIIAGFLTGGSLAVRSGPKAALAGAVGCGILLGVFEGVGVLMSRVFAEMQRPVAPIVRGLLTCWVMLTPAQIPDQPPPAAAPAQQPPPTTGLAAAAA